MSDEKIFILSAAAVFIALIGSIAGYNLYETQRRTQFLTECVKVQSQDIDKCAALWRHADGKP